MFASCCVTSLQPINRRHEAPASAVLDRRGSHATNRLVCSDACRSNAASSRSRKWWRKRLAVVTSADSGFGRFSQSKTSDDWNSTCQPRRPKAAFVSSLIAGARSISTARTCVFGTPSRLATRRRSVPSPLPKSTSRAPRRQSTQGTGKHSRNPHQAVDHLQIAAGLNGPGIGCIELIQNLGYNPSLHYSTCSSAPWQLNPAPKLDIHQSPPAASSASAASSTK